MLLLLGSGATQFIIICLNLQPTDWFFTDKCKKQECREELLRITTCSLAINNLFIIEIENFETNVTR
jgi:hypothetical protein